VAKRYPADVIEIFVSRSQIGFRYSGRNQEGRIIYETPRDFRSRFAVQKEARSRWPGVRIVHSL
jgi:hypothetical protein